MTKTLVATPDPEPEDNDYITTYRNNYSTAIGNVASVFRTSLTFRPSSRKDYK